ncbi:MAG: cob(I)yrinic acid a,c-diamide adenosyltransferase [Phycisphaerae bacterium]|nr:cob(I)yrinic acid a,c-diamide adenosyltransferase [Phycisphaerae bacterium]
MKLYTRSGDDGTTGLFGGGRVSKDDPRIEAYGTVDELNACIGLAASSCSADRPVQKRLLEMFGQIQSRLFDIGADLATPEESKAAAKIVRIDASVVQEIESWIDEIDGGNPPIRAFVLPGGTELAARMHLARTVCRRAERLMVHLAHSESVSQAAIHWINRLSDLLFAMARRANHDLGVADVPWIPGVPRDT